MKRMRTKLAVGTGAALVVVGGGAAVALGGQRAPEHDAGPSLHDRTGRPPLHAVPGGRAVHPRGRGLGLDAAATYLGLTPAELREQLRSGTSLAELARAEGKSVGGLVDALVAAAKTRLDDAVESGRLTAGQRDDLLETLEARIAERVESTGFRHRGFRGGPHLPPPPAAA